MGENQTQKTYEDYENEVIEVRMRVKDYKTLVTMIERERSLGIVAKYVIGLIGVIMSFVAFLAMIPVNKFFGGS